MGIEWDDYNISFKALPIFSTMRANLAIADAFLRRSIIKASDYGGGDLGFLWVEPGEEQLGVHNWSVTMIAVALLQQALNNYHELKREKPTLEYPALEDFIRELNGIGEFTNGMRTIRNGVFHVNDLRDWRRGSVNSFNEVCRQRGGVLAVMNELRHILYEFTGEVFSGELRIWPNIDDVDLESLAEDIFLDMDTQADSVP